MRGKSYFMRVLGVVQVSKIKRKEKMKRLFIVLILSMTFCLSTVTAAEPLAEGWSFSPEDIYRAEKAYEKEILTYEATIRLPKDYDARGGVILGNFVNAGLKSYSFEITTYGRPRLYLINSNGATLDYTFSNVNVCTGEWIHLAVVRNKSMNQVSCYVDGGLKQTIGVSPEDFGKIIPDATAVAGGDLRSGNEQFFRGSIRDIKIYEDARTSAEIESDVKNLDKEGLLAYYDFNNLTVGSSIVADSSENDYDLHLRTRWVSTRPNIEPYDYSFAVIGDTQIVNYTYNDKLCKIYDYICNNAENSKLKFVFGLGDITEADSEKEWEQAKTQLHRMDSIVPYSIVRGNHDSAEQINAYFPYSDYEGELGGSYDGNIENTWRTLTVEDIEYLIFVLDYTPSDAVLNWASNIIKEHPTHNVIITTHAFLLQDGTTIDTRHTGDNNNGSDMWDKFVSKHSNIVLVLCGHVSSDYIVVEQTQGENGNIVTQILVDPQGVDAMTDGGVGLVAMLYFSEGGSKVQVEYYSTIREQWFISDNQFAFDLAVVGRDTDADAVLDEEPGIRNNENIVMIACTVVLLLGSAVVGALIYKKRKTF